VEAIMADNNKPKFDLPWATLLPIIAGLLYQHEERPHSTTI
jgi:hypothetical protein